MCGCKLMAFHHILIDKSQHTLIFAVEILVLIMEISMLGHPVCQTKDPLIQYTFHNDKCNIFC